MEKMSELFDARDQLITEKSVLLEEREQMITAEIQQLKAELEEQKEKTKAAEVIADKALEMGLKATKKWEKEKNKRKMAEEVLQGLQSILHDSVTCGLIPRYKRKPVQEVEEAPLQEEVFHSVEEEPLHVEWGYLQENQEVKVEEVPVQDIQVEEEPVQAEEAEVQVKVEEVPLQDIQAEEAEVQVKVEEAEQAAPSVSAEDVILYHEFRILTSNIPWLTTDLVKAHCDSRGITTIGKRKAHMLQDLTNALNGTPSPMINAEGLLNQYEKKQKENDFKLSNITILRLHCRYHGLSTIGKQKVELREIMRNLG